MEGLLGEVLKLWHVAYDKGKNQLQKVLVRRRRDSYRLTVQDGFKHLV